MTGLKFVNNGLKVEPYECMNCAKEELGTLFHLDGKAHEAFPEDWCLHIQENGDCLLVCDQCSKNLSDKEVLTCFFECVECSCQKNGTLIEAEIGPYNSFPKNWHVNIHDDGDLSLTCANCIPTPTGRC